MEATELIKFISIVALQASSKHVQQDGPTHDVTRRHHEYNVGQPVFVWHSTRLFQKTVPGVIRHSQNARAILVTPSDKKESPLWWHKIVNFIALEPLIEAPRLRRSESGKLKQDLKASRYWFPAWFIFVPWTLCAVVTIVSAALLVIFGLAYASVRSEMWIVATFMFLMISAVILQPLKVMILSLIVTFLFKSEPSSVQEVDVLFLDERDAVVDRKRLLELRTQQMYKPLKTQEILVGRLDNDETLFIQMTQFALALRP
ncbi:hypothetical protein C0J52_19080 [Blattella germanica]|nr:hypothetical protein C0J52_19080 [Blattella germanica]